MRGLLHAGVMGLILLVGCRFDPNGFDGDDDGGSPDARRDGGSTPDGLVLQQLMITRAGDGAGTVTSMPVGITCGAVCTTEFSSGLVVDLIAQPDALSTFLGWSGDCSGTGTCTMTMDGPKQVTATFAALGGFSWSRRSGSSGVRNAGYDVAIGTAGDVFVAGACAGTTDFGGGATVDHGASDIFVSRYSASGTHMWTRRVGGPGQDVATSLVLDPAGDVYITGYFQQTVDFGGGNRTASGGTDLFVAKYGGADGTHLWSRRYGDGAEQVGWSIAVDSALGLMVTGTFTGTIDMGTGPMPQAGGGDIVLARLARSDGITVWAKRFGSSGLDNGRAVNVDSMGMIILTGGVSGIVDFGMAGVTAVGGTDVFLAQFDATGANLWAYGYGGAGDDQGLDVAVDNTDFMVTGQYTGAVSLGGASLPVFGGTEMFLARYDTSGTPIWSSGHGGPGADSGNGVGVGPSGSVVVTGTFATSIDLGGAPHAGAADMFTAEYTSAGLWVWDHAYGGSGEEIGNGIAIDGTTGNAAVTGVVEGPINFGGGVMPKIGDRDVFVLRTRP